LLDVGIAPAERGRQRQRHRPGAGIDSTEKESRKFGNGLGDKGDPIARLYPAGDEAVSIADRLGAKLGERIGPFQPSARIVEIQAAPARGGIVQRFAEGRKVGEATHTAVIGRGRFGAGRTFTNLNHFRLLPHIALAGSRPSWPTSGPPPPPPP
jgi:hypothetical protein